MERDKILENPLSKRQGEVLWLAGCGLDNKEIAISLGISSQAVKNHLVRSRDKLLDRGFISKDIMYLGGAPNLRGTSIFVAESATEHGLILPLPKEAREKLLFLKHTIPMPMNKPSQLRKI